LNWDAVLFGGDILSISERMTLANLASEKGAKIAAFPADEVLARFLMI
jgi:homoaconitase/3-isopropylmalate dehydratase large subunit